MKQNYSRPSFARTTKGCATHSNTGALYAVGVLFCLMLLASCKAPKNMAYFQNAMDINGMALQAEKQIRLLPQDKVNIVVSSSDPMLASQFTPVVSSARSILGAEYAPATTSGSGGVGATAVAYTVDDQGDIVFPVLGKICVLGKTRVELAEYITQRLKDRLLVSDPLVTVEFVNMGVNVLGEVKHPGRINITRDQMTVVDALALAGDLTIDGSRENILVSRHVDGEDRSYVINLTDRQDMLLSPAYYLQQNDVVYVAPTAKRMRESTSAGNTVFTPSFWIAVGSLLTAITALLIKL